MRALKVVDLFAGAGGFSEGARLAGHAVVWAANHWRIAVDVHKSNHPAAEHSCQDLCQADFSKLPSHDLLAASPSCIGHTNARGKEKKHHDVARATAWAVVACAEANLPIYVVVENVAEFLKWKLFPAWCAAMEALGYTLTFNILDAADFGVPQHRERLFIIGTRYGALQLINPKREHIPASSFIDLNSGRWSPINKPGRAKNTLERIARGRAELGSTFLAPYYGNGSGKTGRSLHRPIGTITTRDRYALVHEDRMRMLTVDEYKAAMSFRREYILPPQHKTAVHMLGNAVPPEMARNIFEQIWAA